MKTTAIATTGIFEAALNDARAVGEREFVEGLNADLQATLKGYLDAAWTSSEFALSRAFRQGREAARDALEKAQKKIEEVMASAGQHSKELYDLFMQRMQEFLRSFLARMLELLPEQVMVGRISMTASSMTYSHKIKIGGSLGANLASLCELVSEGELTVEISYSVPAAAGTA